MKRRIFDVALLALVLAGSLYIYFHSAQTVAYVRTTLHKPCSAPIAYRIGTIDSRFGLTKESIVVKLENASELWSKAYGKPLFVYAPDDGSALPVNFIYDRRQQTLALGSAIDSTEASQKDARVAIEEMQRAQTAAQQTYGRAVDALNAQSKAYGEEVSAVNARGGATPQEYARLQSEKIQLEQKQAALQAQGQTLNANAAKLAEAIAAYNAQVKGINQVVQNYNSSAGGDFEEGEYVQDSTGKRIDIYAYKNQAELLHSLAHEMGHALGIDHNQNPMSIMFPYNKSGVSLSKDDISSLQKVCGN